MQEIWVIIKESCIFITPLLTWQFQWFAIGITQNLWYFFQPRLSQTHMASFVHVTRSHLQATMGKKKAFRNCYWCRVLKHSKTRAWTLAGQWKTFWPPRQVAETKTWVQVLNFNFTCKDSVIKWLCSRQGQTVPSPSLRENEALFFGGLYKWHVRDADPISHPRERQQEWEGLWYAYTDVKLWVW